MKINIKQEPYGAGVKDKYEAGYIGFTVNGEYKEFDLKTGTFIQETIKLLNKITK